MFTLYSIDPASFYQPPLPSKVTSRGTQHSFLFLRRGGSLYLHPTRQLGRDTLTPHPLHTRPIPFSATGLLRVHVLEPPVVIPAPHHLAIKRFAPLPSFLTSPQRALDTLSALGLIWLLSVLSTIWEWEPGCSRGTTLSISS